MHKLTAAYAALHTHRDRLLAPPPVRTAAEEVVAAADRAAGAFGRRARVADGNTQMRRFTDKFSAL